MDQLWMEHPDLPDRKVFVTRSQFRIHEKSGWVEADAPDIMRPTSVNVVFGNSMEPPAAPSTTRERFVPDAGTVARTEAATVPESGEPVEATTLPPNLKRDNPHK